MRAPQDRRHKIFRFRRSTTTTSLLHKEELCSGGAVINALGADCYCNRIDQSGALQTLHLHCFLQILFFFCKKNVHGDIYFAWPVALVEFHVKGFWTEQPKLFTSTWAHVRTSSLSLFYAYI
jgi:hypothetical protein